MKDLLHLHKYLKVTAVLFILANLPMVQGHETVSKIVEKVRESDGSVELQKSINPGHIQGLSGLGCSWLNLTLG